MLHSSINGDKNGKKPYLIFARNHIKTRLVSKKFHSLTVTTFEKP